jgi:Flp pilus assembly protein TadB
VGRARARHRGVHIRARSRRSTGVALKLRGESEILRVQPLLDLSRVTTNAMYGSIFVLLTAGVAAAFIAGLWGRSWVWPAIVLLVLLFVAMYGRASTWFCDLRRAAGQPYETGKGPSGGAA